jgi:hypothetical protein
MNTTAATPAHMSPRANVVPASIDAAPFSALFV